MTETEDKEQVLIIPMALVAFSGLLFGSWLLKPLLNSNIKMSCQKLPDQYECEPLIASEVHA